VKLFSSSPQGVEGLLRAELQALGARDLREAAGGVSFSGGFDLVCKACLWSRLANRVLLPLGSFPAPSRQALLEGTCAIPWEEHIKPGATVAVDAVISSSQAPNSHFAALVVKDGIVDRLSARGMERPSVDTRAPDLPINLFLKRDLATVSLDLSGERLHRRGYRAAPGQASLKENLAASILVRAGWPQIAAQGGAFVDPMCGSGTLPIEAALMASDTAPNLDRERFGFHGWAGFQARTWARIRRQAIQRARAGRDRELTIHASDIEGRAVRTTARNARQAGLQRCIRPVRAPLADLQAPAPTGLLAVNPPYGERLGERPELGALYESLGRILHERFRGWSAVVMTGEQRLSRRIGLRAKKVNKLRNGALRCVLAQFELDERNAFRPVGGA